MIILPISCLFDYKLITKLQVIIIQLIEQNYQMSANITQNTSNEAIRANRLRMKQQIMNSWFKPTLSSQQSQQVESNISQGSQLIRKDSDQISALIPNLLPGFGTQEQGQRKHQKFEDMYILKQKLGEGAQAVVYRCETRVSGESFAVKITRTRSPQVIQTIQDSYQMLKNLEHENIVKAHALFIDVDSSVCHLVLQLCEYSDLRDSIEKQIFSSYTQNQIVTVIKKILNAVNYLQQKGICHRDIKPENILYNPDSGQLKLVDFELAKLKKIDQEKLEMWTNTGSLHYRAPQSFEGVYDGKVDIWATGVVAYELFVGEVPFKSAIHNQNIQKIVKEEVKYDSLAVTCAIKTILKRLLEKNPENRASCKEILKLQAFQQKECTYKGISSCSTLHDDQESEQFSPSFKNHPFLANLKTSQALFAYEKPLNY